MGEQSTGHGGAIIEQFTQGTQAMIGCRIHLHGHLTIDERLALLAIRHEALAHSLELTRLQHRYRKQPELTPLPRRSKFTSQPNRQSPT
jgi:hypothetical protein